MSATVPLAHGVWRISELSEAVHRQALEQQVARFAKDSAARLRLAEQVERVQRGPEQDHDYGMSL